MAQDKNWRVFAPEYRAPRGGITFPNVVRAWRVSPDRVGLQIRTTKGFVTANLPFDVARELGAHLISETDP